MKHFKHKKRMIVCLITAVLVVLFIIGLIDVNSRFPQPQEELHSINEWVSWNDDIQIRAKSIDYCSTSELTQKYGVNGGNNDKIFYIVTKLEVNNTSDKDINFEHIFEKFNLVMYPIGYENQGMIFTDSPVIAANSTEEKIACFTVSEGLIRSERREAALQNDIYLCLKAYPVRQAIVFKGVQ